MSTAANHRKRSHRSQSKHWKAAGHHIISSARKQDTGFGLFTSALRKMTKRRKQDTGFGLFTSALRKMTKRRKREKKGDEITD